MQEIECQCELYTETLTMFKQTADCLQKLAECFGSFQGAEQSTAMALFQETFSQNSENSSQPFGSLVQKTGKELLVLHSNNETDLNFNAMLMLKNCLDFISTQIRDEQCDTDSVYDVFLKLKPFIFTFLDENEIIDSASVRNLICRWIGDLLSVITGADGAKRGHTHLKIFATIRLILIDLSKNEVFCAKTIDLIVRKFKCALTYYAANKEFASYIASQVPAIEFLLWILRSLVQTAIQRTYKKPPQNMSETLMVLRQCFDKRDSIFMKKMVDNILNYFKSNR